MQATMTREERPPKRPYWKLGRAIAAARRAADLSQPELAQRVGASAGYIGHIEIGRNRPAPEMLKAIARVLGTDYRALAAAAGYLDEEKGDITVTMAAEDASDVRWLLGLPRDSRLLVRRLGVAALRALGSRYLEGDEQAGEADEAAEEDDGEQAAGGENA